MSPVKTKQAAKKTKGAIRGTPAQQSHLARQPGVARRTETIKFLTLDEMKRLFK